MTTHSDLSPEQWQHIHVLARLLNKESVPANWVRQIADYLRSYPEGLPVSHYNLLKDYLVRLHKSKSIFITGKHNPEQRVALAQNIRQYIPDAPRRQLLLMLYWTARLMEYH